MRQLNLLSAGIYLLVMAMFLPLPAFAGSETQEFVPLLEMKIYPRLETYSSGPMAQEEGRSGIKGNCAHSVLWTSVELEAKGVPFRALDIHSRHRDGTTIHHAMLEAYIDGHWSAADPFSGCLYPKDIMALRDEPVPPVNDTWPGRAGFAEATGSASFFRNLTFVEAYTDLAYTGLFAPRTTGWRSILRNSEMETRKLSGNINLPVSLVRIDARTLAVASYLNAWLVDTETGLLTEITKPHEIEKWFPTGLAYDRETRELFIANYLGKDVLVLAHNDDGTFLLKDRVVDLELVGPENIVLSPDGKTFAVADFDNNGVLLFDRATRKKRWYARLGRAHGVAYDATGGSIVASGLAPPQLVKFGLDGKHLQNSGHEGWDDDGYLWPTSVSLDPKKGQLWISDAHNGGLRQIDDTLRTQRRSGGNGLGSAWFNMPYGTLFDTDGSMWVADTFKSRLVYFDAEGRVRRQYISTAPTSHLAALCTTAEICPFRALSADAPMGHGYVRRINKDTVVQFNFGLRNEVAWNPGFNYTAFVSLDQDRTASLASAAPAFASSIYYWVQARTFENSKAALYGSPQVREWIYQDGEFICPITLGLNFWQTDDGLATDAGPMIPYDRIRSYCDGLRHGFESAMKVSSDAVANYATYVRSIPKEVFAKLIPQSFTTAAGVAYRDAICAATAAEQRYTLSRDFVASMQESALISLPELWIAYLMGHTRPAAGEVTTPLDCTRP